MTGTLSVGGVHTDTNKELYVNGDIEATATLEVGGATTLSSTLDVTGNTEMTGTLSVGGTHADTNKELYVNGDAEVTATLEVGTDAVCRWGHRHDRRASWLLVGLSLVAPRRSCTSRATSSPPPLLWWEPTRLSAATPC